MVRIKFIILLLVTLIKNCVSQGPITHNQSNEIKEIYSAVEKFIKIKENKLPELDDHKDGYLCKACLFTFKKFKSLLLKDYGIFLVEDLLILICSHYQAKDICSGAIRNYGNGAVNAIIEHYVNPEYICSHRFICEFSHFTYLNADDYAREVLKDKPKSKESIRVKDLSSDIWKAVQVSDIHTDIYYKEVFVF